MERCVIHHTSYIVPSSQLPALKDAGPVGPLATEGIRVTQSPCPDSLSHYFSLWGLWSLHLTFFSVPWDHGPLYKAPQAKQSKIDALPMACHAWEGSPFNERSSPFFPISGSHTGHQSGSLKPGRQEFNLYSSQNINDLPHSPNLPGPLTSPTQNLSEGPGSSWNNMWFTLPFGQRGWSSERIRKFGGKVSIYILTMETSPCYCHPRPWPFFLILPLLPN